MRSKLKKLLLQDTLRLVTASVALPRIERLMSANPVQKAKKSMSAKVCAPQMTRLSYSLFRLSVPTMGKPQAVLAASALKRCL
jgi:hypothetical protein